MKENSTENFRFLRHPSHLTEVLSLGNIVLSVFVDVLELFSRRDGKYRYISRSGPPAARRSYGKHVVRLHCDADVNKHAHSRQHSENLYFTQHEITRRKEQGQKKLAITVSLGNVNAMVNALARSA